MSVSAQGRDRSMRSVIFINLKLKITNNRDQPVLLLAKVPKISDDHRGLPIPRMYNTDT